MIKKIKEYQKQYIELIKEFKDIENKSIDDYYLIFDKVELLYKRNKKTIFNYLENNNNYVFYGGATYFNQKKQELYPLLLANKKLIVADPILKLSIFLRNVEYIDESRIEGIIDRAIEHTIELENELQDCYIIYINQNELVSGLKEKIGETAEDLTLQYLNQNLGLNFKSLNDLEEEYKEQNYKMLDDNFPNLNELVQTVDTEPTDTLEQKIYKNFFHSGIDVEGLTDIQKVIMTLVGLFGQAFELKSISICLNVPLYINRINVLIYVNFINTLNEEDKENLFKTNIFFCIYAFFRDYQFEKNYDKVIKYAIDSNLYEKILKKCNKEKFSIEEYLYDIEMIINDDENIEKPFKKIIEN